ncbi:hypothetical protein GCM10025871_41730 [Deinococcus metallilatus]|nr:hypothetical protein GCM10025871_41730 [Deinococcus metallilatus]
MALPGAVGRFFVALALKVVADDHSLHAVHQANSDRRGRWLLALAALAGWDLRQLTDLSELASATLEAFPAGEAVLSVLKEERPAQQQARLSAFALGTFGDGALLLALAAG